MPTRRRRPTGVEGEDRLARVARRKLEPAHTTLVPAGLDPCVVPPDVLKDYLLGTGPVNFDALYLNAQSQSVPTSQTTN